MQKNIGERDISININKENNKISTQSNANNQIESQSKENIRDNSKINIINLINNIPYVIGKFPISPQFNFQQFL